MNTVKKARVKLGLNQEEMGKELGLSKDHISRLERGAMRLHKQTKMAIEYLILKRGLK